MRQTLRGFRLWHVSTSILVLGATSAQANDIKTTFDEQGLVVRSPDEVYKFELGGRFHTDYGVGGSSEIPSTFPDAAAIRRVWIEPTLTIDKNLIFDLQYDLTSRSSPINNLLLSYKAMGLLTITAGNVKEPFSFEQLMSNNDITFMERSLADTFAPGRNTGFTVGLHGDRWTLAGGVFGGNINSNVGSGSLAGTARATYAPLMQDHVLHFGFATSYRTFDRGGMDVSFGATPESFLFRTSLVDTDAIAGTRAVCRTGAEFAWAHGAFRIQSEYILTRVERERAGDLSFQGGYITAAWVLNGQGPKYSLDGKTATEIGIFRRVEPTKDQRVSHGGIGVFEAALRYSALDLTSGDVRGGIQQDITAGLNWYPEPFLRVMANYIHAWADPTSALVTGRPAQADVGQLRIQVAF